MSGTSSLDLKDIIIEVVTDVVHHSGGRIIKSVLDLNTLNFEMSLRNGEYQVYLKFIRHEDGKTFVVKLFVSIDTLSKYLQAAKAIELTVRPGEPWYIFSGQNVLALFETHTKWSRIKGLKEVFVTD